VVGDPGRPGKVVSRASPRLQAVEALIEIEPRYPQIRTAQRAADRPCARAWKRSSRKLADGVYAT